MKSNYLKTRCANGAGLCFEQLEQRNLLAGDVCHNFVEAADVNLDASVTALDALVLINQLSAVVESSADVVSSGAGRTDWLADVDNNGRLSVNDALQVLNHLRQLGSDSPVAKEGLAELATAILVEDLPPGMRMRTAQDWFFRLHEKLDTPLARREAFDHLDGNGDGELTESELAEDHWRRISGADADATKRVTREELKAARPTEQMLAFLPTDAAVHFDFLDVDQDGQLCESEVTERLWARIAEADFNSDGLLILDELLQLREHETAESKKDQDVFARFDDDKNGLLTQDELHYRFWDAIKQVDANADQAIAVEELQQLWEPEIVVCDAPLLDRVFTHFDQDLNGELTENEVGPLLWNLIVQAELGQDGSVTLMELQEFTNAWGPIDPDALAEYVSFQPAPTLLGLMAADELYGAVWEWLGRAGQSENDMVLVDEAFAALKNADHSLISNAIKLFAAEQTPVADGSESAFSMRGSGQGLTEWLPVTPGQLGQIAGVVSKRLFANFG